MDKSTDTRLTDLEIQNSHMARTVDDLSDIIVRQVDEIESLSRRVQMLMERAAGQDSEGGEAAPLADQAPPHW